MEDLAKLFDTLFAAFNSIVTGFLHSLLDVAHDLLGIAHLCPQAFAALSGCVCQRKAGKKAPIFSSERALKSARGVHAWKAVQCND